MTQVSYFQSFSSKNPVAKNLDEIMTDIHHGKYKRNIEPIRKLVKEGKKEQADKKKKWLPAFATSGIFSGGHKAINLIKYSGHIILDFDDIPEINASRIYTQLCAIPETKYAFKSPSGKGIKVIVKVDSDKEQHNVAFKQVAHYYQHILNIGVDMSGADINRLCFVSHHDGLFRNNDSATFKVEDLDSSLCDEVQTEVAPNDDSDSLFQLAVQRTETSMSFEEGNRNNFLYFLACNCNRYGIEESDTLENMLSKYSFEEEEIRNCIKSAYNNVDEFARFAQFASIYKNKKSEPSDESLEKLEKLKGTPILPDDLYGKLPTILSESCKHFDERRSKDIFLLAAISVLSGVLPNVSGVYYNDDQYPNLFLMVVAPPASGKGVMKYAGILIERIQNEFNNEYEEELKEYRKSFIQYKAKKRNNSQTSDTPELPPKKPQRKSLLIPANSSSAAVLSMLMNNYGTGIIFDSEADTLSISFSQDWGNFSDMLRKAFQHETISASRKGGDFYIAIPNPKISVVLSGTLSQVKRLFTSGENGLFSRFMFYVFKSQGNWKDVSPNVQESLTSVFKEYSQQVYSIRKFFLDHETKVNLTGDQWQKLNENFSDWLSFHANFEGSVAESIVKRHGLIFFRIIMVLTAIRKFEDKSIERVIFCSQDDFESAFEIVSILLRHSMVILEFLPEPEFSDRDKKLLEFFNNLPNVKFQRKSAVQIGKRLNLSERTTDNYLVKLLKAKKLSSPEYGFYIKHEKRDS